MKTPSPTLGLPAIRDIRAVLFDMDGTLILSEDRTEAAVLTLLEAEGITPKSMNFSAFHGITWAACAAELVRYWPVLAPMDLAKALHGQFHQTLINDPPIEVPGAADAVQSAALRVPVGIVTSSHKDTLDLVARQLGLTEILTVTVSACDGAISKPAPDPFLLAAQRLGVNPRNCLVFEDSIAGVASARAAGAAVIAIGNATGHDPTISDYRALPNGFFTDITKLG